VNDGRLLDECGETNGYKIKDSERASERVQQGLCVFV